MEYKWKGSFLGWFLRHTLEKPTLRDCLPSLLGDGDKWIEVVYIEEKYSCINMKSPTNYSNQGRTPFICTLLVHICPRFQRSAGATPLWFVHWACRAICSTREFCPDLAALINPVQKISFPTAHFFTLFVLIAQQPGQAVVPGRLSLNMYLRLWPSHKQMYIGEGKN